MENVNKENRSFFSDVDFSYMLRRLKSTVPYITMIAVICGMIVYMWDDTHSKSMYEASIMLVVVPRDNVANKQLESSTNTAVTRCINVLNSSAMYDQIKKDNDGNMFLGSLSAQQLPDTNMIKMVAVSSSSRDALKLLRAGLKAYPSVAGYMESGYLLKKLNDLSANNIIRNSQRALYKGIYVIIGVMFLGIAIVLFKAYMTDKIHNLDQAEILLDSTVIGSLSFVKKKKGVKAILINQDDVDISYVENIDRIATTIHRDLKNSNCKTILITSIKENEGKTTVAGNIALNLAGRGFRVSLVDGDLRRPAVMKIFQKGEDIAINVSEVLEGKYSLDDAKITQEDGVDLYLQRKGISEPDKLLEKDCFSKFIEELKEKSDIILVDTPPLGIIRDSELMAKDIDRAVVVFCQDEIHAADINDTVDLLENAGTTVIGTVMNKRRVSIIEQGIHNYGNYYYYYGYDKR